MPSRFKPLSRLARDAQVRTLDDRIADMMRAAEESGELRAAKSWGKPLDLGDGYDETPAELRIGYKILKDAGCKPAEVALFGEIGALREQVHAHSPGTPEGERLRARLLELEATLALRMESLGRSRKA